ncbi:MAG: glycosyltransferase [Propionicimonas sp.]|uniref:glycosyltransferase n=1 Tax=Propionicimonas sp. TaxID=1955623 RepID=UPI003D0FA1BF
MTTSAASLQVGIFTDDFYPESGGVARSVQLQLEQLRAAGHRVTLFAPRVRLTPPPDSAWEGLPVWRVPGTPSYLCSLQSTPALARRIAADHRLDVVHSQNERGSVFLASEVARLQGVPHVHTFHSNYVGTHRTTPLASSLNSLTYLDWSGRWLRRVAGTGRDVPDLLLDDPELTADSRLAARDWRSLARLASAVDAFTSPAAFLVDAITAASGGALAGRGHVVASGVADAFVRARRRRPRGGPIRFLSCGRLGPEKRVDTIVEAFDRLGRDDAELHIVGTGSSEAGLRQAAARVRHGAVRFLGHFDDADLIAQEIADADVFVLASYRFDTQGLVLAEAAATGTPILYCDDRLTVGVGPDNALLTAPDAASLAAGMAELASDPARLAAMSAASGALVGSLTATAMRDAYVAVYAEAIRTRAEASVA